MSTLTMPALHEPETPAASTTNVGEDFARDGEGVGPAVNITIPADSITSVNGMPTKPKRVRKPKPASLDDAMPIEPAVAAAAPAPEPPASEPPGPDTNHETDKPKEPAASTPVAAPAAPSACVEASEADQPNDAVSAFNRRLRSATDELVEAALEQRDAAAAKKAADARWKLAVEDLSDIVAKGPEHMPLFDGQAKPVTTATSDDPLPDSWQIVPISELSLPPKLTETLAENGIATIGQLEDLRGGAGLRSVKGIGQAKTDLIEDAALKWLSVNRDGGVLAEAASGVASTDEQSAETQPEIGGDSLGGPCVMGSEAHQKQVIMRAGEIEEAEINEPGQSVRPDKPSADWEAGYKFALDFETVGPEACPHPPGQQQDDWLRGWLHNEWLTGCDKPASDGQKEGDA